MDYRNIKAVEMFIVGHRDFRIGQRGICIDFRYDAHLKTWRVTCPRSQFTVLADRLGFDEANEHLILHGCGAICLDLYNKVQQLSQKAVA